MSATLRTGENSKVSIGKVESQEWFRTNLVQQLNLTIRGKNSILQNLWASQPVRVAVGIIEDGGDRALRSLVLLRVQVKEGYGTE